MAARGRNDDVFSLDEFVCQAIMNPNLPKANPSNKGGQNGGVSSVQEFVCDAGSNRELITEAKQVATLISKSSNPSDTAALFQKMLDDELAKIRREQSGR
jgi:hypothetical protein